METKGLLVASGKPESLAAADLGKLAVRPLRAGEREEWDRLMAAHHYLGFQQLVGETLKYVAELEGRWVALLGWGSAAFKCGPRDKWIGWTPEQQWQRLKYVANNQRFLILPGVRIKNLASKVLALNVRRLSGDWEENHGHPVVLAETFVDQDRFAGTCYLAAGWSALGQTRGFGRNGGRYFHHGRPKTVLVKPLQKGAPEILAAGFPPPELTAKEAAVDLNRAAIGGQGGLLEVLAQLKDPRKRRGIRHNLVSILAVAVCACICGARSYAAIGEWAAALPQDLLRRLGCKWHGDKQRYIPPSEPTLRRALQSVDTDELDRLAGEWLSRQCKGDAVAMDGKTLRGSRGADGKPVHLFAALLHQEGAVIAQRAVDQKSNEITAVRPLLEPLDLRGKVVTADAMHAQKEHAKFLVEEKGAGYVFTVKGNQETLLRNIQDLGPEDFSPCLCAEGQRARANRSPQNSNQHGPG
jgi:hypothetical protein